MFYKVSIVHEDVNRISKISEKIVNLRLIIRNILVFTGYIRHLFEICEILIQLL